MKSKFKNLFKANKKEISIFERIIIPLSIIIFLEVVAFFSFIFLGGVSKSIKQNTYINFNKTIEVRSKEIEYKMKNEWSNLNFYIERIEESYENFITENSISSLEGNDEKEVEFLACVSKYLMNIMRANSVSGTYLILCRDGDDKARNIERNAIALCDLDPSVGRKGSQDIITTVAAFSIADEIKNVLSSSWSAKYLLKKSDSFYFDSIKATQKYANTGTLGFWDFNHTIPKSQLKGISYTVPLIDKNGKVYAVLGVEITDMYIAQLLPFYELVHNSNASYCIAYYDKKNNSYVRIADSGFLCKNFLQNTDKFRLKNYVATQNIKSIEEIDSNHISHKLIAGIKEINLLDGNVSLNENRLFVLGLVNIKDLFKFYNQILIYIFIITALCFGLGSLGSYLVARLVSSPIAKISSEINGYSLDKHKNLKYSGIKEIDNLIRSIESLSIRIYENQENFSRILQMTKLPVGAFEYNKLCNEVHFTDTFFDILHTPETKAEEIKTMADYEAFILDIEKYIFDKEDDNTIVYKLPSKKDKFKFVRYHFVSSKKRTLGTVIEITKDVVEKEKIKHDRDTDILTDLLNRRAFMNKLADFFDKPKNNLKAIIIMMDVDKLKYVNDNFGHKYGDKLIKTVAENLNACCDETTISARLSGDEFIAFSYGFNSHEELEERIKKFKDTMNSSTMTLPNGREHAISLSGGYSIYPDDSADYHQLLQYADMAMYKMKKERRGSFVHYSEECNIR